jgi:hypothetical protein
VLSVAFSAGFWSNFDPAFDYGWNFIPSTSAGMRFFAGRIVWNATAATPVPHDIS